MLLPRSSRMPLSREVHSCPTGQDGWDNYLLSHHWDRRLKLDVVPRNSNNALNGRRAKRALPWLYLSDLWLDTEIDRRFLASALAKLSYSVEELDEICTLEVAPQLYLNLESIAGEWAGFDQEWLEHQIIHYLNSKDWREKAWNQRSRTMRLAGGDWSEIRAMIKEIRESASRTLKSTR
jgi:hypothetical protein